MYSSSCTVATRSSGATGARTTDSPAADPGRDHAELVASRMVRSTRTGFDRVVVAEVVLDSSGRTPRTPGTRLTRRAHAAPLRPRRPGRGSRSRAASIAVRNAARTLWSSSCAHRRGRGAARRGDLLAQHGRVLTGLAQQLGRADHGLHDQLGRGGARQPEVHAGLDHRLDDEEQVRRPGAADRGDRVLLVLRHPQDLAGGRQQRLGPRQVVVVAVRAGRDRGHALVDQGRGVRHDPDHRDALGHVGLDECGRDAGRQRDHQLPARRTGAMSVSRSAMSCGLTTNTTVSASAAAARFSTTRTPYLSSSSAARSGRFSPTSRSAVVTARAHQAREQASPPSRRRPGSRRCPSSVVSFSDVGRCRPVGPSQPVVASERRKNATLLGRSANRRMR